MSVFFKRVLKMLTSCCTENAEEKPLISNESKVQVNIYICKKNNDIHQERMAQMRERVAAYRRAHALLYTMRELRHSKDVDKRKMEALSKKLENDLRMLRLEHERQRQKTVARSH
jgi:hypothetical protein